MKHAKNLLSSGWYHATIRKAENYEDTLRLTWTIDRGDHSYRNIIKRYPLNDWGMERLRSDLDPLGFIVYTDYSDPFFYEQFSTTDFRGKIKLDRRVKDDVIINIITEYTIPDKPADYNVKKPKSEEFYHQNNNGRKLPIKEE